MFLFNNWEFNGDDPLKLIDGVSPILNFVIFILVISIAFVLTFLFLVLLLQIIMWLLFFVINRNNSTGKRNDEIIKLYVKKNGLRPEYNESKLQGYQSTDVEVEGTWFYFFPVAFEGRKIKLRVWKPNSKSRSLFSIANGLEQAHLITGKKNFSKENGSFGRIISLFFKPFLFCVPILLILTVIYKLIFGSSDFSIGSLFTIFIFFTFGFGISLFWIAISWWQVMYRYRMKNEIIKGMKGLFRNEKDEKIVNLIITLGFLYWVAVALYYTLSYILRLILFLIYLFGGKRRD